MPICPNEKCGKEIITLIENAVHWITCPVHLDKNGDIESDGKSEIAEEYDLNGDLRSYSCPECGEIVCESYPEAEIFLRGGKTDAKPL